MSPERGVITLPGMPDGWVAYGVRPEIVQDWWRSGDPRVYEERLHVDATFQHRDGVSVDVTFEQPPDPARLTAFLRGCESLPPGTKIRDIVDRSRG